VAELKNTYSVPLESIVVQVNSCLRSNDVPFACSDDVDESRDVVLYLRHFILMRNRFLHNWTLVKELSQVAVVAVSRMSTPRWEVRVV